MASQAGQSNNEHAALDFSECAKISRPQQVNPMKLLTGEKFLDACKTGYRFRPEQLGQASTKTLDKASTKTLDLQKKRKFNTTSCPNAQFAKAC